MRKIVIWGAGEFGSYVFEKINDVYGNVVAFIDNNPTLKRKIPVISPDDYIKSCFRTSDIWLANSSYYDMDDIVYQMHEIGIRKVWVVDPFVWKRKKDIMLYTKDCYLLDLSEKAVLNKLEFHVADHCNLNCLGCSHFSPVFSPQYAEFESFQKDVQKLADIFSNIFQFRLMGGEPFLNEQLDKFIKVVRSFFPNTHLTIVTNGLLYKQVNPRVWEQIKESEAFLQISLYQPTAKIKKELEDFLNSRNILFSFGSGLEQYNEEGIIEDFHKCLTLKRIHNRESASKHCFGASCHFLRDGKISKCAYPLLAEYINKVFGTEFIVEEDDFVDIFKEEKPWSVVDRLHGSIPFCGYCIEDAPVRYRWQREQIGEACIDNYVIKNEEE